MSSAERKAIDNAIWLCAKHAREIDRDENYFTVELLHQWKTDAEQAAITRHGDRILTSKEVEGEIRKAISGIPTFHPDGTFTRTPFLDGIDRMHRAQNLELQTLDPRFITQTSYVDKRTLIEIRARTQKVPLTLQFSPDALEEANARMRAMLEWGKGFQISSAKARITGSPLIETLSSYDGILALNPHGIAAAMKMYLLENNIVGGCEILSGKACGGTKGATVICSGFDEMITVSIVVPADATSGAVSSMDISIDIGKWDGKDIRLLPHYRSVKAIIQHLARNADLRVELDIAGQHLLTAAHLNMRDKGYFQSLSTLLDYIEDCRELVKLVPTIVLFKTPTEAAIPSETVRAVRESALIARKQWKIAGGDLSRDITFQLTLTNNFDGLKKALGEANHPRRIRIMQIDESTVSPFGQTVVLPKRVFSFGPTILVLDRPIEKLREGMTVGASLQRFPDSVLTQEFETDERTVSDAP